MATNETSKMSGMQGLIFLIITVLTGQSALVECLVCYCDGHCPSGEPNGTCVARLGSMCFSASQEVYNPKTGLSEIEVSHGCLPPHEKGLMQCNSQNTNHHPPKAIKCCNDRDLCNRDVIPQPIGTPASSTLPPYSVELFILVGVFAFLCMSGVALFWICMKKKEQCKAVLVDKNHCSPYMTTADFLQDFMDQSSGSGSGLPLLVQRTIAKQLQMVKTVGHGRYGEVWLAQWRGGKVAVKIFLTTEEASWFRETEIYQTTLMRHENILGFIAADIKGTGSWTQMLLITDYHENGSLHDYLQTHALDPGQLQKMALSIASGLHHLHREMFGTKGKPAIAHRDIKSKNILVKNNDTCAIADFGLAVRYISESDEVDIASNTRVGTRRYMAPEVLNETLDTRSFEAYKSADMYSFGLVLWEMGRRTLTGDKLTVVDDYRVPYWDCVPSDPSFEDMHDVVCVKGIRPPIPTRWQSEEVLRVLAKVMQECWHQTPGVRLPSLRVKKTLGKLGTGDSALITV